MKNGFSFNLVYAHPPYLPAHTAVKEEPFSHKAVGHGGPPPNEPAKTARDGQRKPTNPTTHQTRNAQPRGVQQHRKRAMYFLADGDGVVS